jgi:probable addiction module antidote protein
MVQTKSTKTALAKRPAPVKKNAPATARRAASPKKEKLIISDWDPAEYIATEADVIGHIEAALEYNDIPFLLSVMGHIARSKGMAQIARRLGKSREGLYRSLAPGGNPSFQTVVQLLDILGFRLKPEPKTA